MLEDKWIGPVRQEIVKADVLKKWREEKMSNWMPTL